MHAGRWLALPVLCLLTACGFHSVYGTHDSKTPVAAQLNQVAIDSIPDQQGQMLRNDLIDRMYVKGRPQHPIYKLRIKLRFAISDLGIQANATTSRSLMDTYGDYALTDMRGKELLHGTAHSIASFNKLNQQFGTLAAQDSAYQSTINDISDQIVNRLSLYFSEGTSP